MNIYIIDLKNEQICKTIKGYETDILTINKIKFNDKEECLINLDYYGIIKIWNIWFNILRVCGGDIFEVAIVDIKEKYYRKNIFWKIRTKNNYVTSDRLFKKKIC